MDFLSVNNSGREILEYRTYIFHRNAVMAKAYRASEKCFFFFFNCMQSFVKAWMLQQRP